MVDLVRLGAIGCNCRVQLYHVTLSDRWLYGLKLALYTLFQHKWWTRWGWVQLGAIVSHDPVRQAITMTESTTPLNVDPDSNASLWYALREVDSLTIRRILTLTLYRTLIYNLRRGRGRCNWVQFTKMLRMTWNVEICENHKKVQLGGCNWQKCSEYC